MSRAASCTVACILVAFVLPVAIPGQDGEPVPVPGPDGPELGALLDRTGEQVRAYYRGLENLAWTTEVRHEVLEEDLSPREALRELVFEVIVRLEPQPDDFPAPFFVRELREQVAGEPVDEGFEPASNGFFTANVGELFLLPEVREAYDESYGFSYAGRVGLDGGRGALVVDVAYPRDPDREPRVEWQGNRFFVRDAVISSRIWIDPDTYDVLRFDWQWEPISFSRFLGLRRMSYERRTTTRFTRIAFDDGEEVFLVPESFESVQTVKGGRRPVVRTLQSFSDYRRFQGEVRITPSEDPP